MRSILQFANSAFLLVLVFFVRLVARFWNSSRMLWAWLLRIYVHYCVQASTEAKCPCCGVRETHQIRWSDALGILVHVCTRCRAVFSESPLVAADKWRVNLVIEEEPESKSNADGTHTTTVIHAQREPVIVKDPRAAKPPVMRMGA